MGRTGRPAMNDKVPPRSPFGVPGERTVVRPNPGGRRPAAPSPGPGAPPASYNPVPQVQGPPQPVAPQATPYVPPTAPGSPSADEWISTLRRLRPKVYRELSPRWQGQKLASRMLRVWVPWWGVLGFVGLLLFGVYFVLLYWLTGGVDAAAA